jgi:hypothetical protein
VQDAEWDRRPLDGMKAEDTLLQWPKCEKRCLPVAPASPMTSWQRRPKANVCAAASAAARGE